MKKKSFLLLAVLPMLFFLSGCGSNLKKDDLTGSYKVSKILINGSFDILKSPLADMKELVMDYYTQVRIDFDRDSCWAVFPDYDPEDIVKRKYEAKDGLCRVEYLPDPTFFDETPGFVKNNELLLTYDKKKKDVSAINMDMKVIDFFDPDDLEIDSLMEQIAMLAEMIGLKDFDIYTATITVVFYK